MAYLRTWHDRAAFFAAIDRRSGYREFFEFVVTRSPSLEAFRAVAAFEFRRSNGQMAPPTTQSYLRRRQKLELGVAANQHRNHGARRS